MRLKLKIITLGLLNVFIGCSDDIFQYSAHTIKSTSSYHELNLKNLERIHNNPPASNQTISIAVISDSHFEYDRLMDAVKNINSRNDVDFVVHLGDMAHHGMLFEYEQTADILNRLNRPFLAVLGNHDCLANGREIFSNLFGPSDMHFVYNGVFFLLFNNNNWESILKDREFFYDSLNESRDAAIHHRIVMSHIPFYAENRFTESFQEEYYDALEEYDVDVSMHGHTHVYTCMENDNGTVTLVAENIGKSNYILLQTGEDNMRIERINF